jgi:hypothetical protein
MTEEFYAFRGSTQSVPSGVWTTVVFPSERFDIGGSYNTATGAYAPAAGKYHIHVTLTLDNLKNGGVLLARLQLRNGGDYYYRPEVFVRNNNGGNANTSLTFSVVVEQHSEEPSWIAVQVFHDHGSNRNISGTNDRSTFSGAQV